MLDKIGRALLDYQARGECVITNDAFDHVDCREVAEYVIQVLNGLKCSFDHYYNDVEMSYFIQDNSN